MKRCFILALARLIRVTRPAGFAVFALLASLYGGCGASHTGRAHLPTRAPTIRYMATLRPLNASGVSGSVQISMTGNALTVSIHASGLEANREHYQHIHGAAGGTVNCPTAADANASGLLTVDRGLAVVGPIALDLYPYPQVTVPGPVDWSQTYTLTADTLAALASVTGHVVVLHGMTLHGTYDRALFVACGVIQAA